MSSTTIYHYVYRITNIVENKHYYGKRSSKIEPKLDIGFKYFSSSRDKEFMLDQKLNPQNYKYKVVFKFLSPEEACDREIILHTKFSVSSNTKFYNKANAKYTGFGIYGLKFDENIKLKMSGESHSKYKGDYVTPYFTTQYVQDLKKFNIRSNWCKNSNTLIKKITFTQSRYFKEYWTWEEIKGKTFEELGFGFIYKERKKNIKEYKNAGENHRLFMGYYITPFFTTDESKKLKKLGIRRAWCKIPDRIINKISFGNSKYLQQHWSWDQLKNKTFSDIGFGFKSI